VFKVHTTFNDQQLGLLLVSRDIIILAIGYSAFNKRYVRVSNYAKWAHSHIENSQVVQLPRSVCLWGIHVNVYEVVFLPYHAPVFATRQVGIWPS